jgi:hypothetical protein
VGLLSSLLASAADTRPGEVVIETDQPVRLVHAQGAATLGEALTGDAVFDALAEVLTSEQQADLALGEPVKFDLLVGDTTWHLVGETAREVTAVRARPGDGAFEPADSVPIPIEPDEPDPQENVPRLRRRGGSMPPAGQSDIDIEIQFDDDAVEERAGVRLAALRPITVEAEPRSRWPRQVSALASANRAESPRRRPPGGPPRGGNVARRSDLDVVALAMPAGTFGFIHRAPGQGAQLARALQWPVYRIAEGSTPAQALAESDGLADGAALLVDLEDPSPWLAWLLRRVEEGRRVLIETRATTPAGARRIVLGVAATPRAEEWLAAIRVVHATLVAGEWTLLNPET